MLFFLPLMLGIVIGVILIKHAYRSAITNAASVFTTTNRCMLIMWAAGIVAVPKLYSESFQTACGAFVDTGRDLSVA